MVQCFSQARWREPYAPVVCSMSSIVSLGNWSAVLQTAITNGGNISVTVAANTIHDFIDSTLNNPRGVALVTGGATGIGRALCEELAARGVFVVVADINQAGAKEVASALAQRGWGAEAVALDVSRATDVEAVVNEAATRHGQLDFIFNNAAVAAVGA